MPVRGVRDTNVLLQWRTVSRAVLLTRTETGDARAGRTPRGPIDPTSPWKAPGMRVGTAPVYDKWACFVTVGLIKPLTAHTELDLAPPAPH